MLREHTGIEHIAAMGMGFGKLVAAAEPLAEAPVRKDSRGPRGDKKREQPVAWAAFSAHHLSSSKEENGRLDGLLLRLLYTLKPESTSKNEAP